MLRPPHDDGARNTVMIEAVAELPPIVISDLFGLQGRAAPTSGSGVSLVRRLMNRNRPRRHARV
jgi:hypothetical protein